MDINDIEYLSQILHKSEALKEVLEREFLALKEQDLEYFEKLQIQKTKILEFLSNEEFLVNVETYRQSQEDSASEQQITVESLSMWDRIIGTMLESRTWHQRNEILINTKLESIKSALRTIQSPYPLSSVEVYDKLGKLRATADRHKVGDA